MSSFPSTAPTVLDMPVDKSALLAPTYPSSDASTPAGTSRAVQLSQRAAFIAVTLLSVFVALFSYRYLIPVTRVTQPGPITSNLFARPFLYIHAGAAATALLLGPFQFIVSLRRRYLRLHRISGRLYVLSTLLGGVSAIPLSLASNYGPWAQSGFFLLAVLWLAVNSNAWRLAILGRIAEHKQWMQRSFALTFSAVTLRAIIFTFPPLLGVTFDTAYRFGSWACWLPSLLLIEAWLRYHDKATSDVNTAQAVVNAREGEGNAPVESVIQQ